MPYQYNYNEKYDYYKKTLGNKKAVQKCYGRNHNGKIRLSIKFYLSY